MKTNCLRFAFAIMIGTITLSGCLPKSKSTPTTSSSGGSGNLDPVLGPVQAGRRGAQKVVTFKEFEDLKIYLNDASLVSGRMPTKDEIIAATKQGHPKVYQAIMDGQIVLTGASSREAVWAYQKDAPKNGGIVLTSSGVETMSAQQLRQRLEQDN